MGVDLGALLTIGSALAAGGAAFGGVRVALNGTRKRVERIADALDAHTEADAVHQREVIDRLARIETKLER